MAQLPLDQLRAGLPGDPRLYPQNLSLAREQFLFLKLERHAFDEASFLDDRILSPDSRGRWLAFSELSALLGDAPPPGPLHFIFHSGHVGSTLISRLLDGAGGVLGLREPLPLRVLAEAFDDLGAAHAVVSEPCTHRLLAWCCHLWCRRFADTEAVIVKATSSAGRMAAPLLRTRQDARAIFVSLGAEPYLATLLSGANSHIDLRGQGPERYKRLARLGVDPALPLHAMSLGEIAALTWLTETLTQRLAQREHGARLLPVDFDAFLASPAHTLQAISTHFGLARSDELFAAIADGPVMRRYSKAPDRPYSPALRQEILMESRRRNGEEIHKGLAWLDRATKDSALAQSLLST